MGCIVKDILPVNTICMHGSPMRRLSNFDLWKRYDYRELGIVCEPYLVIDFYEVLYLTAKGSGGKPLWASFAKPTLGSVAD